MGKTFLERCGIAWNILYFKKIIFGLIIPPLVEMNLQENYNAQGGTVMNRIKNYKLLALILLLIFFFSCETATRKDEKKHIANANRAIQKKDFVLAAEELLKAIEINQNNPLSHYNLAYVMETELNDPDSAIEQYELAIKFSPNKFSFAYKSIGKLYYEIGNFDRSIEAYRSAVEKLPKDALARNDLAVVLTRKGLIKEAIEELKKAMELDPNDETVKKNLEKAYILLKKSKENNKEEG